MTIRSFRSFCATSLVSLSLIAVAGSAMAQDIGAVPLIKDSKGDTLKMNCAQAHGLVKGTGGTVLNSGANHFDLYHVGGATCQRQL